MNRISVRSAYLTNETTLTKALISASALSDQQRMLISHRAATLVDEVRATGQIGVMESFLAEYGLSTDEGVALMCLAEAMLRVPDNHTIDELIRDKITSHDWASHIGDSGSIMVNASTWGLMLTGKVLDEDGDGVVGTLHGLMRRMGEPIIRKAVAQAMAEMGSQFVLGRTITEAMKRGDKMVEKGFTYSYDMLGEAACTDDDAVAYHRAYAVAIDQIAKRAVHDDVRDNPSISVKLSALHPRYEYAQRETMLPVMSARLLELAQAAKAAKIGFNIDAEEADRLDLSMDVIETVLADESLAGWDGFGVVVQAFGRRAMPLLDWLYALAKRLDRKIMVRLVKGAYWDQEIKRAQIMGLEDYPVFTRKSHTDVSYLACARKLLGQTDRIFPQFATHNAHSIAAVLEMAEDDQAFEFQRLHGMGEILHNTVLQRDKTRCRIYAPVGAHEDLLAYLVRRLLENGANSSFVNQIVDEAVPSSEIAKDPITSALETECTPSPSIRRPRDLFNPRQNSRGYDITDPIALAEIDAGRAPFDAPYTWAAAPITPAVYSRPEANARWNPARPDECVGSVMDADVTLAAAAVGEAVTAQPAWGAMSGAQRADIMLKVADIYEDHAHEIFALVTREAGKTLLDGVAELREAVDFLRYYAGEAVDADKTLKPRGVIVCISPWNFPLAIFTGQIAAALAAGNAVIAKPAEQTPLIAERATQWMLEAGVPAGVLQLLPGNGGTVGAALTADPRIGGVCFTGSTDVAKLIDVQLAKTAPSAMLIAETGGLNAMIVDSTALLEQATRDIIRAAFQSAGQRCSALRVLYVQKDIAKELIEMLSGAMDELAAGDPWRIATDVSVVIDGEALEDINAYIAQMKAAGQLVKQVDVPSDGHFVAPTILKIESIATLEREIFGPVLHLATFEGDEIDAVVDAINETGFGLTFGIHTRIDQRVQHVLDRIHVGNAYVNRDQIGAIVGSQPFGGHGLSGTGPKAGGPQYLRRFLTSDVQHRTELEMERTSSAEPLSSEDIASAMQTVDASLWSKAHDRVSLLRSALRGKGAEVMAVSARLDFSRIDLPGPTGEANQMALTSRGTVLCLGPTVEAVFRQAVQALVSGNRVVAVSANAVKTLAPLLKGQFPIVALDGRLAIGALRHVDVDLVAFEGGAEALAPLRKVMAARKGAIINLVSEPIGPEQYCLERTICIDTTAAGGNATLLSEGG
jgi:RHH-type proline utilization regulon transcriptional repressor/proline dehydrogenase/delta 1-pyrroline-5-carboxylate dehydrogenase